MKTLNALAYGLEESPDDQRGEGDGHIVVLADESPQDASAGVRSCVVQISQSLLLIYVEDLSSEAISLVWLSSSIGSTH